VHSSGGGIVLARLNPLVITAMRSGGRIGVWLALLLLNARAFYLPGIAPVDYESGADVDVFANKVTSPVVKVPFGYYSIPECPAPENVKSKKHRNLGQILSGERTDVTGFKISMLLDETCKVLCERQLTIGDTERLRQLIRRSYRVRLNVDNMPLVVAGKSASGKPSFQMGYPLGAVLNNATTFLYNHLELTIEYHRPEFSSTEFTVQSGGDPVYRIVGFMVNPSSRLDCSKDVSQGGSPVKLGPGKVKFTYDVKFVESQIKWATRWDPLLAPSAEQKQVQWFSIVNSIMVTVFLSGIVALVLLRTVHQDFLRYNQLEDEDEIQDETGWKLIHGDVFRPPPYMAAFCVVNGAGAQVFWMSLFTIGFAVAGFLSPANRGGFLSASLFTWAFTGVISGYVSAKLYATFGGENKRIVSLGSMLAFPGFCFSVFFVLNLFLWFNGGSNAVPFLTLIFLLFLWFGLSVPLTLLGSHLGYRGKPYEYPCRTNSIPREVPPPPMGIRPPYYCIVTGLMPFGVVFIELVFILGSLWQNQVFYMFGFLLLVFLLMIVTCCEVSIVFTYMKLSAEDYRWWWHAFSFTAFSGVYVLMYSILYLLTQTEVHPVENFATTMLYLGYMGLISTGFALLTGYLGFISSFWFIRRIYSRIRVD